MLQNRSSPIPPPVIPVSRKRFARFQRVSRFKNDPPFTRRTWFELGLVVLMFFAQQDAPGFVAEWSAYPLSDWQIGIYARLTAFWLAVVALFGIRAMRPVSRVFLMIELAYLTGRISETRITHEPLTVAFALLLVMFCLHSGSIIIRPNEHDVLQERNDLRKQAGEKNHDHR